MSRMPEYRDYPLDDCAAKAAGMVRSGATVHQKFTCQHCGSRQAMATPNVFYARGICEECKAETDIRKRGCNYVLIVNPKPTEH
jgi:hypothetical protein